MDGRIARILKSISDFGAQLDSFADFLNFGAAPAFLLYFWKLNEIKVIGWILVMIYHGIQTLFNLKCNHNNNGIITHIQAFATVISGTVGLGTISGVAIAITIGGPSAVFWMVITGILGMSIKFAEVVLAFTYRSENATGGAFYYMKYGLAKIGFAKTGRFLAFTYAIMLLIAMILGGIPFQANQIAALSNNLFEYNASIIISLLVFIVILGGIKRIAFVSTSLAPTMIVLYVGMCIYLICMNGSNLLNALSIIFQDIFNKSAIGGGVLSGLIAGVRRSVFANEAGTGTAAIAHSSVKEEDPIKVGCVAMIAPLIDTILISFLTGIVIIITGMHSTDNVGDITLISSFLNIRMFKHAFAILCGKYDTDHHDGHITHFQAFMTALSSTVGLGTVAGVAIAVSMGGPGAVPWMMITGFFGMSAKFAEVTLAFRHRTEDQEQLFSGPFQYIKNGLEEFGFKKLGIVLAAIYAVFFVLSGLGGSVAFQTNQMVSILSGYSSWILFSSMIDFNAVGGGMVGAFVAGIQRAIFASEAGVGSAAITHATTKDEEPVRTGLVAMIEPCFDTMLTCCLTGITIVITAVLGHMFPIWLKFKGGKGVATTLGVLIALNMPVALIFIFAWIVNESLRENLWLMQQLLHVQHFLQRSPRVKDFTVSCVPKIDLPKG
uniref:Amino acid carrier protein n=1 Tax=Glossina austeni TaxID=7395 RepID=A0A1A9VKB0_GLOAU